MDRPAAARTAAALARAARAGPFFVVEPWTPAARWRPLHGLVTDPSALAERVGHARGILARRAGIAAEDIAERVAASVVSLGLIARLVSPQLGAAVLGGVVPGLTVADLWWRPAQRGEGGPWPLAAGPAGGAAVGDLVEGDQIRHAARLMAERIDGITAPVTAAFATSFRLSHRVLRGNVASALAGASATLAASYPARAGTAHRLTEQILALEPLRGTGEFIRPDPAAPRLEFVRRSCCLLYRVPGAGTCGDCVLTAHRSR
jgi:FhuF 2Fe-2S C-terminal domain